MSTFFSFLFVVVLVSMAIGYAIGRRMAYLDAIETGYEICRAAMRARLQNQEDRS